MLHRMIKKELLIKNEKRQFNSHHFDLFFTNKLVSNYIVFGSPNLLGFRHTGIALEDKCVIVDKFCPSLDIKQYQSC